MSTNGHLNGKTNGHAGGSLAGKVAIVTRGSRGIGAGIVSALVEKGAKVAFNYTSGSSEAAAQSLIQTIEKKGGAAVTIKADMANPSALETIVNTTLKGLGTNKIDILVNNAGLGTNRHLRDLDFEFYERIMNVNVRGLIFLTQAVLPHISRGRCIINLSSISARGGMGSQTVYEAAKAAVEGLTRVWATELGQEYGVTINAVNPEPVDTDMYRAAGPVVLAQMTEQNKKVPAAPRCGTPEDVADIISLLCKERSRWISDDVICANGGMIFI